MNARLHANPKDAFALYLSSKVWASFGNLDKGLECAEEAVALEPHSPDFLSQLAEMHVRLADRVSVLKQINFVRKFRKEVDTALSLDPRHVDTFLVNIMFLSRAPMVAGGDKKRANAMAQQLVQIDPNWGYLVQARIAEADKDDARIERVLTKAIEAKPSSYLARYSLAKFYCCVSVHHRLDAAERQARDAIRVDPGQSGGYDILARVFAVQQRWPELDAILVESESKVPDDLSPYYQAANSLIDEGKDLDRAERYLKKYLSQEPEGRQPTAADGRRLLASIGSHRGRNSSEAGF